MTLYDGLDEAGLAALTGAPRVVVSASTTSALDVAHALGEQGAVSGTVVLADEQTAGRGRLGRAWHSPRGAGIWLAVLLRPPEAPASGALAIRIGLAAIEAIAQVAPGAAPLLKWPNDIVVGDRKVGGVLCEARWAGERVGWVAAGIGINVRGPLEAALAPGAAVLAEASPAVTRPELLRALVPRVLAAATQPPELAAVEREAFARVNWLGRRVQPEAVGVDRDGALLVRTPDGSLDRVLSAP